MPVIKSSIRSQSPFTRKGILLILILMIISGQDAVHAQSLSDLQISEIMYHPQDRGLVDGDSLEFIELKNTGASTLDLTGVAFTDGIDYRFGSGATLAAGDFIVLARNALEFEARYGTPPFGTYTGRLNNAGERITLSDAAGLDLQSILYSDRHPWPMGADGIGFSIIPLEGADPAVGLSWRTSTAIHGSPGDDDPARLTDISRIVVNEVLTHTDLPFKDAIELYNPTSEAADLSGWFLTDELATPEKFKLPAGTTIQPNSYLVFDEDDFNPNPGVPPSFALSSFGDAVYLFAANASGDLTGHVHGFEFGGADNGVSFGRFELSTGADDFPPQQSETLGASNAGPANSRVKISEIMYNPAAGGDEFIELYNFSGSSVSLYDPQFPENTWRISGVGYNFPPGTELAHEGVALVVAIDPETFRTRYGVPASVGIYGPYTGTLSNGGELIRIEEPDEPDLDGTVLYFSYEWVEYGDDEPWPVEPDGEGESLVRDLFGYKNDPFSWTGSKVSGGTPGAVVAIDLDVSDPGEFVNAFRIESVYPNPFSNSAEIQLGIDRAGRVKVSLVDVLGREIQTVMNRVLPIGSQTIRLEAAGLSAGFYFVMVEGPDGSRVVQPVVNR